MAIVSSRDPRRSPTLDQLAAGAALVHDELRPTAGSSVVVFGCGPTGLGAVIALADLGCRPIMVVDEDPRHMLAACELGATHVIDPGMDNVVAAVRSVRRHGVRYAVDTVGDAPLLECLALAGVAVAAPVDCGVKSVAA